MTHEAVRDEIFALASDLPAAPLAAMQALRFRGKTVVPSIVAAIRDDQLGGVALGRLLQVLTDLDPEAAVDEAQRLVRDPRSNVQREALRTLAAVGTPAAIESLRSAAAGANADAAAYARILLR